MRRKDRGTRRSPVWRGVAAVARSSSVLPSSTLTAGTIAAGRRSRSARTRGTSRRQRLAAPNATGRSHNGGVGRAMRQARSARLRGAAWPFDSSSLPSLARAAGAAAAAGARRFTDSRTALACTTRQGGSNSEAAARRLINRLRDSGGRRSMRTADTECTRPTRDKQKQSARSRGRVQHPGQVST